jgi:hypothetical protein
VDFVAAACGVDLVYSTLVFNLTIFHLCVGFYARVLDCKLKFSYEQINQEHAMGDGSRIVTTRRALSCS